MDNLAKALSELLEQIECLRDIEFSLDVEPYKAEANWDDAVRRAQDALLQAEAGNPMTPRLVELVREAQQLIGAHNDDATEAVRACNANKAWHLLDTLASRLMAEGGLSKEPLEAPWAKGMEDAAVIVDGFHRPGERAPADLGPENGLWNSCADRIATCIRANLVALNKTERTKPVPLQPSASLEESHKNLLAFAQVAIEWAERETEYDGRMYTICNSCGGQDGDHRTGCKMQEYTATIFKATSALQANEVKRLSNPVDDGAVERAYRAYHNFGPEVVVTPELYSFQAMRRALEAAEPHP